MKLGEVIKSGDFSIFAKCTQPSFYNYYSSPLEGLIYPDGRMVDYDHYDAMSESGRLVVYAVKTWMDSDTTVGMYLYVVDDNPICISYQTGRKNYPEWFFVKTESLDILRKFFDEFKPIQYIDDSSLLGKFEDFEISGPNVDPRYVDDHKKYSPLRNLESAFQSHKDSDKTKISPARKKQVKDLLIQLTTDHDTFVSTFEGEEALAAHLPYRDIYEDMKLAIKELD